MSEKCFYLSGDIDVEFDTPCSDNNGYGVSSPDSCDDCEEYFCSKHLRQHKRDGTCRKIREGNTSDEKPEMVIAGVMNWEQFRDRMIKDLEKCDTEQKFCELMMALEHSFSHSEEEMQKKRRKLGIPET